MLKMKRLVGILLTVAMLLGVCPMTVFAATDVTYTGIEVRPQSVSSDIAIGDAVVTLRAASDKDAQNFSAGPDLKLDCKWYYMYYSKSDIPASDASNYTLYETEGLSAYIKPVSNTKETFSYDYVYLCIATVSTTSTSTLATNCTVYPTDAYAKQTSTSKIEVAFEVYAESEISTIAGISFTCNEDGALEVEEPSRNYMYVYRTIKGDYDPFVYDNPVGRAVGTSSINKADYAPVNGALTMNGQPQVLLVQVNAEEWNNNPTAAVYGYGTYIVPMSTPYIKVDSLVFGTEPSVTEIGTTSLGVYGWDIAQASCNGWYTDREGTIPAQSEQDAYLVFTIRSYGLFAKDINANNFTLLFDNEAYTASYIEVSQSNSYLVSFFIPSDRISISLSAVGDGGQFYFCNYPNQNSVSLDVNDSGMAIRELDIGITVYPGYYVKSIKLNGELWEDARNPFSEVEMITHHQISNTENYQAFFSFRATENSVFEIEFGVADIVTIEYGDNIPCYTGEFANEKDWHSNGKYYVSETYVTQLCYKGAIRDNNATKRLVALNTKPDGSGYNLTPSSLTGYFVWEPIDEFSNGVSDKITLYAILECTAHTSYGVTEAGWEYFDAKAPTCDTAGNVAYRHCRDCDIYQIVADKNDYDVIDNEKDPSNYTYYKHSTKNGVILAPLAHDYSQYKSNDENTHTVTCVLCGGTKIEPHKYVNGVCVCESRSYFKGDVNGDGKVNDADATYLLHYTFFPEDYPINQPADFNGDKAVTDADAVHLLYYTLFPEDYPLN